MDRIEAFLQLVSAYGAAKGLSDARISTLVFDHGGRVKRLREGSDMGARRMQRAVEWFDQHWPEDLSWPASIDRPVRAPVAA